ncbi:MAG: hypothetical protein KGY60_03530 [Bacteroidales bacterium]|nr:hypothetical protein [Bacteroidales bacterium]
MMAKLILTGICAGLLAMPFITRGQTENPTSPDSINQASADTTAPKKEHEDLPEKYRKSLQQSHLDTVYFFDRETIYVNVMKITYDSILYREPGETDLKSMGKDPVNKIKYNWGRLEILNEEPPKRQKRYDWRKVEFLKNESKASGMQQVKEIIAQTKGSGRGFETPKSLEVKAKTILRKKAANVNAQYVLITNKTINTAFGEIPSATLTGIAYSTQKNQEKKSVD